MNVTSPKPVIELEPGDRVDLEDDPFADPRADPDPEPHSIWSMEYGEVSGIDRETPDRVRVDFENGPSVGFPVDHVVRVYDQAKELAYVASRITTWTAQAIVNRGGKAPSDDVQRSAAELIVQRKVSQHIGPAVLYHVQDSGVEYPVTLVFANNDEDADVVDGECACDDARNDMVCKHLTAVLAQAHAQGHSLQV